MDIPETLPILGTEDTEWRQTKQEHNTERRQTKQEHNTERRQTKQEHNTERRQTKQETKAPSFIPVVIDTNRGFSSNNPFIFWQI
jgi:hypothetical protein